MKPDWKTAPKWARYLAINEDGQDGGIQENQKLSDTVGQQIVKDNINRFCKNIGKILLNNDRKK